MKVFERELRVRLPRTAEPFVELREAIEDQIGPNDCPIRFAVSAVQDRYCQSEVGLLNGSPYPVPDLFAFIPRTVENTGQFTVALLVPTGIGCEIGGHAGDAGSVARLMGAACDRVLLHPNVVNASDINEMPSNALYVEGSVLTRLLQGTVSLQPVRANRVLVVTDAQRDRLSANAVVNSINAARACYGLNCPKLIVLDPPVRLRGEYTPSGRAAGNVEGMERLLAVLEEEAGTFDAVALAGGVELSFDVYTKYLNGTGSDVNPVGGVEAIYTHTLSLVTNYPSAHAPIFVFDDSPHVSAEVWAIQPGIVDPRMAAEVISIAFLQCVLKGLQRSPRILPRQTETFLPGTLTASDVSCLVIPDGVLGLPVWAALQQKIPVIAVRENGNKMQNDLTRLPWLPGQFIPVDNYLEAAGVLTALRSGLSLASLRRPLHRVPVVSEDRWLPKTAS